MVTITIGSITLHLNTLDEGLLLQQINRRRDENDPVCVVVKIDEPTLKLFLATPECERRGRILRALTTRQEEVVALWRKHHLNDADFDAGQLVAFLKQLRRLIP